ncbi:MAG: tetratricopeptide repeat protein [Burkholderiales bacterium]|jgi:protein O-GlcNAc transferase|nr:tetratricopeptide repeat protein [Burkholderiales bacterium]
MQPAPIQLPAPASPAAPAAGAAAIAGTEAIARLIEIAEGLRAEGRDADAVALYTRILEAAPAMPAAWNNLALALVRLGHVDAAIEALRTGCETAPHIPELWANLAEQLHRRGARSDAIAAYRRALDLRGDWPEAWNNLGILLRECERHEDAISCFARAIEVLPGFAAAHYNLGNALRSLGRIDDARASFDRTLALDPANADAVLNRAGVETDHDAAAQLYALAEALDGPRADALAARACEQLMGCDWDGHDAMVAVLRERVLGGVGPPASPFQCIQLIDDAGLQQACARRWTRLKVAAVAERRADIVTGAAGPLRIGYLSGDFRDHAVGRLIAPLIAAHDRERVEVYCYATTRSDGSAVRGSVEHAATVFREVPGRDAAALADVLRTDRLHVLVDLSGYTEHGASNALSHRPAPVQATYLGFPGTLGNPAVDALIADRIVIPPANERHFDEEVVRLGPGFQPWPDTPDPVADTSPGDWGLPPNTFVFCSFNAAYKLKAGCFSTWMEILKRCDAGVLWLLDPGARGRERLAVQARRQGVDPRRLVFAPRVTYEQHAGRLAHAHLFLDTFGYSAGATAAQTLLAGVPMVTLPGESYAARMGASVLTGVGGDSLVAGSVDGYVDIALAQSGSVDACRHTGRRLREAAEDQRDARLHARALEDAYLLLVARAGERLS